METNEKTVGSPHFYPQAATVPWLRLNTGVALKLFL